MTDLRPIETVTLAHVTGGTQSWQTTTAKPAWWQGSARWPATASQRQ
jgi:hypothetical protein